MKSFSNPCCSSCFGLWQRLSISWFSSHSYPYSAAPWGNVKCAEGLAYYGNETALVAPGRALPVIITETGWRTGARGSSPPFSAQQQANWTSLAFKKVSPPRRPLLRIPL